MATELKPMDPKRLARLRDMATGSIEYDGLVDELLAAHDHEKARAESESQALASLTHDLAMVVGHTGAPTDLVAEIVVRLTIERQFNRTLDILDARAYDGESIDSMLPSSARRIIDDLAAETAKREQAERERDAAIHRAVEAERHWYDERERTDFLARLAGSAIVRATCLEPGEHAIDDDEAIASHALTSAVDSLRARAEANAEHAEVGRQWCEDSSLAKWFPLTAERLAEAERERDELLRAAATIGSEMPGLEVEFGEMGSAGAVTRSAASLMVAAVRLHPFGIAVDVDVDGRKMEVIAQWADAPARANAVAVAADLLRESKRADAAETEVARLRARVRVEAENLRKLAEADDDKAGQYVGQDCDIAGARFFGKAYAYRKAAGILDEMAAMEVPNAG